MGRPVRRVLFQGPSRGLPSTAISLGDTLPCRSSGLPEDSASRVNILCLTLLRTRFTWQAVSPRPPVVSYSTLSPLPHAPERGGGLLSVALSRGSLRVGVTHRPALWSPDVPRCGFPQRDRPAAPFARSVYFSAVRTICRSSGTSIGKVPNRRLVATAAASRTASAAASACSAGTCRITSSCRKKARCA